MLTIILAILLALGLIFLFANFDLFNEMVIGMLVALIVVGGIIVALTEPLSGYKEWELVQETELVPLKTDTEFIEEGYEVIYVYISSNNTYTYRYEIDSELGTETSKEYKTNAISMGNVDEVEDPNCKIPVIRKYTRDAKMSIWTFALFVKPETKYVFYVPEGTIVKDAK